MSNLLLTICSIAVLCTGCSSIKLTSSNISTTSKETPKETPKETSKELQVPIYNNSGEPIVYIDYSDENTIYTYDGDPVAYIRTKNGDDLIFGFNGKFLGWYVNGAIYDTTYCAVGAKANTRRGDLSTNFTRIEQLKSIKKIKPIKSFEEFPIPNPILSAVLTDSWSKTTLTEFFNRGK